MVAQIWRSPLCRCERYYVGSPSCDQNWYCQMSRVYRNLEAFFVLAHRWCTCLRGLLLSNDRCLNNSGFRWFHFRRLNGEGAHHIGNASNLWWRLKIETKNSQKFCAYNTKWSMRIHRFTCGFSHAVAAHTEVKYCGGRITENHDLRTFWFEIARFLTFWSGSRIHHEDYSTAEKFVVFLLL